MELDGHPVQCCVDTGSTRLAISSTLMENIFGPTYSRKLRQYPLGKVSDAQGKQIRVLGFYYGTLAFSDKMTVTGYIMVFNSTTSDLLLGLKFLQEVDLAFLPNQGLLNYQGNDLENIQRLNYDLPNIE